MPFSVDAHAIFDHFKSSITQHNLLTTIPVHTINAAQLVAADTTRFHVTSNNHGSRYMPIVSALSLVQVQPATQTQQQTQTTLATISRSELGNFMDFVEDNTDNNYRNVKDNARWRTLYGVRMKTYETYDSKTNLKGTKDCLTTYCQHCKLLLPLRNLTIDHQKPQQGGDMEAMVRVFRALGLTVSTGTGTKNRYLQSQYAGSVGGNTTVISRGGTRGTDQDRYSLSNKGALYLSVLHYANQYAALKTMCMHHIANLRPMCGPCNSGLRNSNVTFWLAN
jgi:hypothetical protein